MENKINIAELLKDCPSGMELDCTMYDSVTLLNVNDREDITFPIKVLREDGNYIALTKYGQYTYADFAKCVIFPKGKTTWEGFVSPCKFKDGDVVATKLGSVFILKNSLVANAYSCYVALNHESKFIHKEQRFGHKDLCRFATEKEKQKLFQAIKANGYRWNADTKTLEKFIEPKFKVGDRIVKKNGVCIPILITGVGDTYYWSTTENSTEILSIAEQDDWELVPDIKPKFKVGDRIRSVISNSGYIYNVIEVKESLYVVSKNNEYDKKLIDFKVQDYWELVSNKFDIDTLVPFESRVLVRNGDRDHWRPAIFGGYAKNKDNEVEYYYALGGTCWRNCIPYEGNEHLSTTTDDCDKYYKN